MDIKSLVGALAVATQAGDLTQSQLVLLTAVGAIFGTPVFGDDPAVPETEVPRTFLRACFDKLDSPQSEKRTLCGSENFFLLKNVSVVPAENVSVVPEDDDPKLPFLFVRYDSVLACTVGSIDYK